MTVRLSPVAITARRKSVTFALAVELEGRRIAEIPGFTLLPGGCILYPENGRFWRRMPGSAAFEKQLAARIARELGEAGNRFFPGNLSTQLDVL